MTFSTKLLLIILQLTGSKAFIEDQPERQLFDLSPRANDQNINHLWKNAHQPICSSPEYLTENLNSIWLSHVSHQHASTETHLPPLFNDARNPPAVLHASELAHSVHNSDSPEHPELAVAKFSCNRAQSPHLSLEQAYQPSQGNLNDSPYQVEPAPQSLPVRLVENHGFAPADHDTFPHRSNENWPAMPLFNVPEDSLLSRWVTVHESPLAHSQENAHVPSPESALSQRGQSYDSHQGYPNHLLPQVSPLPMPVNLAAISRLPFDHQPTLSHASPTSFKKKAKGKATMQRTINGSASKKKALKAMQSNLELISSRSLHGQSHDYHPETRNPLSSEFHLRHMQARSTYNYQKTWQKKSSEDVEKTNRLDLWNTPLLPYYVAAFGNYPLSDARSRKLSRKNIQISQTAKQALSESSFKISSPHDEKSLSHFLGVDTSNTGLQAERLPSAYDFMRGLVLKNLAFLTLIHDTIDHQIKEDTKKMLDWLYKIFSPTNASAVSQYSESVNALDSDIVQIVRNYLQTAQKNQPNVIIQHSKEHQKKNKAVREFQAKELQVMIIILASYYKSANPEKWRKLFPQDINFVKFYLRLALCRVNRDLAGSLRSHQLSKEGVDLLPWDANVSEVKLSCMPALFNNPKDLCDMIIQRVEPEGEDKEKWIELLRFVFPAYFHMK